MVGHALDLLASVAGQPVPGDIDGTGCHAQTEGALHVEASGQPGRDTVGQGVNRGHKAGDGGTDVDAEAPRTEVPESPTGR